MSPRSLAFALTGAVMLALLFIAFRPAPPAAASVEEPGPAPALTPQTSPAAVPVLAELVVKSAALVSGPSRIRVRQGDAVILRVTSDRADELHLHGYELEAQLRPGVAANLSFIANRSGRFDLELHRSHLELAALEVEPIP